MFVRSGVGALAVVRGLLLAGTTLAAGLAHGVLLDADRQSSSRVRRSPRNRADSRSMPISTDLAAQQTFTVTDDDTAAALDRVTCRSSAPRACSPGARRRPAPRWTTELTDDETSVGTRISLEHLARQPGRRVLAVTAIRGAHDGRLVRFTVAAADAGSWSAPARSPASSRTGARFLARLDRRPVADVAQIRRAVATWPCTGERSRRGRSRQLTARRRRPTSRPVGVLSGYVSDGPGGRRGGGRRGRGTSRGREPVEAEPLVDAVGAVHAGQQAREHHRARRPCAAKRSTTNRASASPTPARGPAGRPPASGTRPRRARRSRARPSPGGQTVTRAEDRRRRPRPPTARPRGRGAAASRSRSM